ncbi:HORMA domain-containing protein [Colletotrichum higginsianum]|nr:HORMA domain-containing protein [Colletotrichum higginsianum]
MASETKPAKPTKAVKTDKPAKADKADKSDKSKVHKLALKGSAKLVAEFPPVSSDDQVRAYIKKIMGQLDRWMLRGKISKLVIVITDKDTGEHVERWQFDVEIFGKAAKSSKSTKSASKPSSSADQENDAVTEADADAAAAAPEKTEQEIQSEIAAIFRQITASVTFLPQLSGDCTFNVLVYADADSEVPVEWGDSDAKEIANGERVQLRGFSTSNHRVDTLVSYRLAE